MKRKIISIIIVFVFFVQSAYASILGSVLVSQQTTKISHKTVLYENEFMSDQSGVGLQSEYYAEYTPNTDTVPYVVTGEQIYGKRTAQSAYDYMRSNGLRPMIGINASYFSTSTGVPMGHVICDGKVLSKDSSTLQSIGFRADGTGFIMPLSIGTTLKTETEEVEIFNVNKYNVATIPYTSMYTRDFAKETKNTVEALTLIMTIDDGKLAIGKDMKLTVSDKFITNESILIPDNSIVVLININGGYEYHYNILNSLEVGDTVRIETYANDKIWDEAVCGLGSEGETLITNGKVNGNLPKGAAPRSAVGITENGNIILYTIDGRQTGHSYGVQLKTLATRLKELGCIDAINLDGGGSTSITGVYPGADEMSVINSPSDGKLRSVTNFIFLKNNNPKSDILESVYVTPHQKKYLTGATETLSGVGIDTNYYKTEDDNITYTCDGDSVISGRTIKFIGDGTVNITATCGDIHSNVENYVYDTPDGIVLYCNGNAVDTIKLKCGESVALSADAYVGYSKLISDEGCFSYNIVGDIGTIENNIFTANDGIGGNGQILVKAGNRTVSVSVEVINDKYIFSDIGNHWAKDMIAQLAKSGIVNGYDNDGRLYFNPDNSITRAEFAVMFAKFCELDLTDYADLDVPFEDSIPEWAKQSVVALYSVGYISGKESKNGVVFAGNDKITRAEAASIIGRMLQIDGDTNETFADIDLIPEWAKKHMLLLKSMGIISGYEDNTVKPQKDISRAEVVTMLYKLWSEDE